MCLPPSNQIGLNCLHSSFYVVSRAICKPGLQLLFKRGRLKKKKKKSAMFGSSKVQQFDVMSAITAVFVFLLLLLILMEDKHSLLFQSV